MLKKMFFFSNISTISFVLSWILCCSSTSNWGGGLALSLACASSLTSFFSTWFKSYTPEKKKVKINVFSFASSFYLLSLLLFYLMSLILLYCIWASYYPALNAALIQLFAFISFYVAVEKHIFHQSLEIFALNKLLEMFGQNEIRSFLLIFEHFLEFFLYGLCFWKMNELFFQIFFVFRLIAVGNKNLSVTPFTDLQIKKEPYL